jgi:hypothetical protein
MSGRNGMCGTFQKFEEEIVPEAICCTISGRHGKDVILVLSDFQHILWFFCFLFFCDFCGFFCLFCETSALQLSIPT